MSNKHSAGASPWQKWKERYAQCQEYWRKAAQKEKGVQKKLLLFAAGPYALPVAAIVVLLPLLLILLARVLRLSQLHPEGETLALVALIPSFAPSANAVSQFSQIYGRDAKYAGLINAVTMLLCIITLPLMVSIYQL